MYLLVRKNKDNLYKSVVGLTNCKIHVGRAMNLSARKREICRKGSLGPWKYYMLKCNTTVVTSVVPKL